MGTKVVHFSRISKNLVKMFCGQEKNIFFLGYFELREKSTTCFPGKPQLQLINEGKKVFSQNAGDVCLYLKIRL